MEEELGDRVRKARLRYGMSITELAKRIGVTRQQLTMIERNRTANPGALTVRAIARVLHVSTDYLLEQDDASV